EVHVTGTWRSNSTRLAGRHNWQRMEGSNRKLFTVFRRAPVDATTHLGFVTISRGWASREHLPQWPILLPCSAAGEAMSQGQPISIRTCNLKVYGIIREHELFVTVATRDRANG